MSVWNGYIYSTDDIGGGLAAVCRVKSRALRESTPF